MYWQNNFIVSFGQLLQGQKVTESKSIFGQIYFFIFPIFVGHRSSEKEFVETQSNQDCIL
jgi:hypothetical protein